MSGCWCPRQRWWYSLRSCIVHFVTSDVGGSYSARVPRSSAEVHREFVHHILEDEVDGQKEGQGDQREDGEEGEVNGIVEERAI